MRRQRSVDASLLILIGLVALLSAPSAQACSVCYGEPGSPMVEGIQAGVLVLLGVVGSVLIGIASLLIFWMRRASRLGNESLATNPVN